jgi:uncharacterized iron-regulated membrane protein
MIPHHFSGRCGWSFLLALAPVLLLSALGISATLAWWSRTERSAAPRALASPRAQQMALAATYRSLYRFPSPLHP